VRAIAGLEEVTSEDTYNNMASGLKLLNCKKKEFDIEKTIFSTS